MKELLVSDVAKDLPTRIKNILADSWSMTAKDFCNTMTACRLSRIPNCGQQTVALLVKLFGGLGYKISDTYIAFGFPEEKWGRSVRLIAGAVFSSKRHCNIMRGFIDHMATSDEDLGDVPWEDMGAEEFCAKYTLSDIVGYKRLRVTKGEGRAIRRAFAKEGVTLRVSRTKYEEAVRRIRALETELGIEPSTGW